MVRFKITLNRENINKVRAVQNGVSNPLTPVSRIDLRIPSIGIVIEDSTSDAYPIKWEFDPADDGLVELQLGTVQSILDAFIVSTTGDTETGSQWISNIPATDIAKFSKYMSVNGLGLDSIPEIVSIDREDNRIKLSKEATSDATGAALSVYEDVKDSFHRASLYIYNVDYPNGIYWGEIELAIGF